MKSNKQYLLVAVLGFVGLTGFAPAQPTDPNQPNPTPTTHPTPQPTPKPTHTPIPGPIGDLTGVLQRLVAQLLNTHPEIPQAALNKAFGYLNAHASSVPNKDYVTIIDFNKPSTQERMFIIRVSTGNVNSYLVAHGKNSGENFATTFSNVSGSEMSSLGIYLTGNEYQGGHGRSMILRGQESTNSNAESRAIVLHGADYVSPESIASQGRLGRSWGCPAVEMRYHDEIVKELEDGSVFLIYHD